MVDDHSMTDHDSLIRLEGQILALTQTVEAHNIASVERDTRIEQGVNRVNGTVKEHTKMLDVLWVDRSIWNWTVRFAVLATPLVVLIVNYYTR